MALHHAYGAIESALVRVSRALEGDVPGGTGWRQALLTAMRLDIDGVRPAILSEATRHACGVALDPGHLEALREVAVAARPLVRDDFQRLDGLLRALADADATT